MDPTPATDVDTTPRRRRPRRRAFPVAGRCMATVPAPQPFVAMPTANAVEGGPKTRAPIRCTRPAHGLRNSLRVKRKNPTWLKLGSSASVGTS